MKGSEAMDRNVRVWQAEVLRLLQFDHYLFLMTATGPQAMWADSSLDFVHFTESITTASFAASIRRSIAFDEAIRYLVWDCLLVNGVKYGYCIVQKVPGLFCVCYNRSINNSLQTP